MLCAPNMPPEELYDCEADPHEIMNLASTPERRVVLNRLRSVLEKWIEDSHDQGKELEPLDLVRRKGMTKTQTNPQSGYSLDEKTLKPKTLTVPDRKP